MKVSWDDYPPQKKTEESPNKQTLVGGFNPSEKY